MNRIIKFRGKRIDNDEWIYGYLYKYVDTAGNELYEILTDEKITVLVPPFNIPVQIPAMHQVKYKTIGQFTGLYDKNGKEIFEGDIFNLGDNRILYIVEWFDTGLSGRQNGNSSRVGLPYWQSKIEIIGNIYENSEMLED